MGTKVDWQILMLVAWGTELFHASLSFFISKVLFHETSEPRHLTTSVVGLSECSVEAS